MCGVGIGRDLGLAVTNPFPISRRINIEIDSTEHEKVAEPVAQLRYLVCRALFSPSPLRSGRGCKKGKHTTKLISAVDELRLRAAFSCFFVLHFQTISSL